MRVAVVRASVATLEGESRAGGRGGAGGGLGVLAQRTLSGHRPPGRPCSLSSLSMRKRIFLLLNTKQLSDYRQQIMPTLVLSNLEYQVERTMFDVQGYIQILPELYYCILGAVVDE